MPFTLLSRFAMAELLPDKNYIGPEILRCHFYVSFMSVEKYCLFHNCNERGFGLFVVPETTRVAEHHIKESDECVEWQRELHSVVIRSLKGFYRIS